MSESNTVPDYAFWPDGAREGYVKECNCDWCNDLEADLERQRAAESGEAPATEEGDASLEAFTEAKA